MNLKDLNIDKSWAMFLDRDGVINNRIIDDYIKRWEDFKFIDGVLEAMQKLSLIFGKILIVTNQQGIDKGLMTENDLNKVHAKMIEIINKNGGRIDKIYFSPYLEKDKNVYRKPGIGMALQAKNDFPSIDFTKSIMVGDSITDMQFGKNAGMLTVFISGDSDQIIQNQELIDFRFKDLYSFAETIKVNDTKIIQGEAEV